MQNYNPNSIWGSKEKKYSYDPKTSSAVKPLDTNPASPSTTDGPSFFHRHKLMFFTVGLLLAVGLVGLVFYLLLPAPAPNITISFQTPDSIVIGQPFPLSITVSNESKSVLKNARLDIILPAGVYFLGKDTNQSVVSDQIDSLSSQTINPPEHLELIATGNPGLVQDINAELTYETAETATTQYQMSAKTNIVIGQQAAIGLTYTAPSSIFSGENFDTVVNYANNSTGTLQDVQLKMQYPPAYTFSRSSLVPSDTQNDTWDLGSLAPNATGTITITGNIIGPPGEQYQLVGTPIVTYSGQNYTLDTTPANFLVAASPLSLSILLNGTSSYITKLGDALNYTITYTNNSSIVFQGSNVSISLMGKMFDFSSVKTSGAFNSNTNSITWNAANTPGLLSIAPGQSGSISFSINTKKSFPITLPSDKNYFLKVTAQINSPTVPPNTAGTQTKSVTSLTNKVGGLLTIAATGYKHDPTFPITNSGPYPPVVNSPSEYTIHWDIINYSTDAQNVTVSAYLQSGSTFTGQVKSNVVSSTPTYDPATGLVSWTIPLLPATTGVISSPAEAVFQVSNTPSITQAGQSVTLLGATSVSSTDAFTGVTNNTSADAVTTELPNDPSIKMGTNRSVIQ